MSVKRIVNLPTVAGWIGTAGGAFAAHTLVVDLPVGPRYHAIKIRAHPGAGKFLIDSNGSNGLIGELRLKVNGKVQRTMTADQLNKLNILNGVTYACRGGNTAATEAVLFIWLAEPWRKAPASADGTAWGTGDVATFQLEIDIRAYAGAAAGLTKPECQAIIDNSLVNVNGVWRPAPLGIITKWLQFQLPVAALSSWHDFTGLPKRDFYQSIHLIDANIDQVQVKVDNTIIREGTLNDNLTTLYQREMVPNPTATATPLTLAADMPTRGMWDVVFDEDDRLDSALPMEDGRGNKVQDLNLRVLTGSGGVAPRNITTIVQLAGAAE